MISLKYITLIVFLCVIGFNPASINHSEFVFDDLVAVVRNDDVTNTTRPFFQTIRKVSKHDFWGVALTSASSHKSYRPITTLMFNIEYRLFDSETIASRMKWTNLWIHCIVCCALLDLLPKLLADFDQNVIISATILFAIHPIHTEAVAGVVGRADLLCALFFIIALRIFIEFIGKYSQLSHIQVGFYLFGIFTTTFVATFCKEIGITALLFCILYDIRRSNNFQKNGKYFMTFRQDLMLRTAAYTLMMAFIVFLRLYQMDFIGPLFKPTDNPIAAASSPLTKTLSQHFLYALNFWLLLCPDWLCFDWSFNSIRLLESWNDLRVSAIIIFATLLLIFVLKGSRDIHTALFLMIIPFLPASGIIRVGFVIAERILYIPSIGFCLLVGIGFNRLHRLHPRICKICACFLCLLFVLRTNQRTRDWTNEKNLFESAIRVCPENAKVYYNIGRLASHNGDDKTAKIYYEHAIKLHPKYDAALMNLGNLYRTQNKLDTAETFIQKSIEITEEFPTAWMNLGIIKAMKGKYADALSCYQKAMSYRKNYHTCMYNLGNLFLEMKNHSMAMHYWRQSLSLNPKQARAWVNILTLLDSQNKIDEVIKISARALEFIPDEPSLLFLRANAFGKLGYFAEAEELYRKSIAVRPNYALCHMNLGVLYHRWNKTAKAIESYRNSLTHNPRLPNAHKYLNQLLKKGKPQIEAKAKIKQNK